MKKIIAITIMIILMVPQEGLCLRPVASNISNSPDARNVPIVSDILSTEEVSPLAREIINSDLIIKGAKVLSLGSGNGNDEVFFAKRGLKVLATDNHPEMIAHLEKKAESTNNLSVQTLDVTKPFLIEDASFDVVYIRLVLHYFPSSIQPRMLAEIYRVLKLGGLLIIQVKSKNDILYRGKIQNLGSGMFFIEAKGVSRNHLSLEEMTSGITTAHFRILRIGEHNETLYSDDYESTLITAICKKDDVGTQEPCAIKINPIIITTLESAA